MKYTWEQLEQNLNKMEIILNKIKKNIIGQEKKKFKEKFNIKQDISDEQFHLICLAKINSEQMED